MIPKVTYRINPEVSKILSPVVVRFEDGSEIGYPNGASLAADVFDKHYNIASYSVRDDAIVISVYEFFEKNK